MRAPVAQPMLATFEAAAAAAGKAEAALRKRMETEVAAAERERAFAYRRLHLMRLLARAIGPADNAEAAVGLGLAAVRAELGWESDSDARTATLGQLAAVVRATFAGLTPEAGHEAHTVQVTGTLADFEAWYVRTYGRSFWMLFEQEIAELPLVER